jgi:hypothetical protein
LVAGDYHRKRNRHYDAGIVNLKELNTVIERAATIIDQPKKWGLEASLRVAAPNPLIA